MQSVSLDDLLSTDVLLNGTGHYRPVPLGLVDCPGSTPPEPRGNPTMSQNQPSVRGSMFVFDSRRPGNLGLPSGAERSTAVAWSPDDRFTALAAQGSVYVYPGDRPGRAVTLPLMAIELDWR